MGLPYQGFGPSVFLFAAVLSCSVLKTVCCPPFWPIPRLRPYGTHHKKLPDPTTSSGWPYSPVDSAPKCTRNANEYDPAPCVNLMGFHDTGASRGDQMSRTEGTRSLLPPCHGLPDDDCYRRINDPLVL